MRRFLVLTVFASVVIALCLAPAEAQRKPAGSVRDTIRNVPVRLPSVTLLDGEGFSRIIKPNGKPLLINFWATWCIPCREEFPELVKIDAEYRGKIDFITVSLDDLAEIRRDVPRFLFDMKAEMPAYLLRTPDEDAAIRLVAPDDWAGGLPVTVLFAPDGTRRYFRKGLVQPAVVRLAIDSTLNTTPVVSGD